MTRSAMITRPTMAITNQRGVTLMETMVYLVIAGILLATAVTSFLGQNKSYNRQDVIAEIQQNIRGATELVASDVRLAGIGLKKKPLLRPFEQADSNGFAVIYLEDYNDSGSGIRVHYRLDNNELQRAETDADQAVTAGDWQKVAENIDEIYFEYLYDVSDIDDIDTVDWQWTDSAITIFNDPTSKNNRQWDNLEDAFEEIRAVKIVILGSARQAPFNQTDQTVYHPPLEGPDGPDGANLTWVPVPGTGYKRMMSSIAQCRNNFKG